MVRYLSVRFLHRRTSGRLEPVGEEVGLVIAFAACEQAKKTKRNMVGLAPLALPLWAIQVAPNRSILVSATAKTGQRFQFTENKRLSEFRRILAGQIQEPSDIPRMADQLVKAVESSESGSEAVEGMVPAEPIAEVGHAVTELDTGTWHRTTEIRAGSQEALGAAGVFKRLSEASRLRTETLEELRRSTKEKLGNHLTVLENVIVSEKSKWSQRVKLMEDKTEQDIDDLRRRQKDTQYTLQEKQKVELRALTAELARATNDIEQFFVQILEKVRNSRAQIGQRADDVAGAVDVYRGLASSLSNTLPRYAETLKTLNAKCDELLAATQRVATQVKGEVTQKAATVESEASEKRTKLENLKTEMQKSLGDLEDLKKRVQLSNDRVLKSLDDGISVQQSDFLKMMAFTLDGDKVKDLAPLTQIQVQIYAATFDDGTFHFVGPSYLPEDRIGPGYVVSPLGPTLDSFLNSTLETWVRQSPNFKNDLIAACNSGNLLKSTDGRIRLLKGLTVLYEGQLLREGFLEHLSESWAAYATKCPRCGADVKGSRFCPKCGLSL